MRRVGPLVSKAHSSPLHAKVSDAERSDLSAQLRAAWDAMPWWGEAEEAAGGDARKPDFAGVRFFKVPFVQVRRTLAAF